jgi:hypothetical protein
MLRAAALGLAFAQEKKRSAGTRASANLHFVRLFVIALV